MEKREMLYEGKAKQVFATNDDNAVILYYKDDATAYNAEKRGNISNKGVVNNQITAFLYKILEQQGIATHFREQLSDREQLCDKVTIIPLEMIVRNRIAGSMAKRLGIEEGTVPPNLITELSYKDDALGDPLINDHHAVAIGATTYEELAEILEVTKKINTLLQDIMLKANLILIDFKIEFGRNAKGELVLADEITPDTCRLWDADTLEKLDKDRFRRDLGGVEEAYLEVLKRVTNEGIS
jgi:phosphoribosylaminoimidazole-succinocarboxamide synthase